MLLTSGGGTASNTRTGAANFINLNEELDRHSPVARPTTYSNCWAGATREIDFATAALALHAAKLGARAISAATKHECSFSPSQFTTRSTIGIGEST